MNSSENNNDVYYIIDITDCSQTGNCVTAAPGIINIDSNGDPYFINGTISGEYRVLYNPPASDENALLEAIANCPCGCISVETKLSRKR
ncbi:MAG: ferredoxin [Bacteroidales bacterium]